MNPRDDLPGDDIPRDATISRLYRELPDAAPAPETDAAILAAARRAVGAGPRRHGFVAAHWRGLGSAAAALLLGVALTVQWRTQQSGRLEEALATAPTPAPAATREDTAIDALFADEAAPAPGQSPAPAAQASTSPARSVAGATAGAPSPAPDEARAKAEAVASAEAADTARAGIAPPAANLAGAEAGALPGNAAGALHEEAADTLAPPPAAPPAAPAPMLAAEAPAPVRRQVERKALAQAAETAPAERRQAAIAAAPAPAPRPLPSAEAMPRRPMAPDAGIARADTARGQASAPAGAAAPALPAYARLMAEGRHAEALAALGAPATPAAVVDRDLLRQWLQPGSPPACADIPAPGAQALLCEGLRLRAAGRQPGTEWRAALERAGLASGAFDYRRDLVDKLFGPAPQ